MKRVVAGLLFGLLATGAFGAEVQVTLPGRDGLVLTVPDTWKSRENRDEPNAPPTIALTANARDFMILVIPLWSRPGAPEADDAVVRKLVQTAADSARPKAVDKSLPLTRFTASGKTGYYFAATDREPEPDGYKYLTQGMVAFDELRVTFTVLVNGNPEPVTGQAMQMLRTMRRLPR